MDLGEILKQFGFPIFSDFVLGAVIIYLYKALQKLQEKYDLIQEQRIVDARETRDKISEPLDKQAIMSEKIYDLLLNFTRRD